MSNISFSISQEVLGLGVTVIALQIPGISNFRLSPELDAFPARELAEGKKVWIGKSYTLTFKKFLTRLLHLYSLNHIFKSYNIFIMNLFMLTAEVLMGTMVLAFISRIRV